ncbi:DUF4258 domain-containing protein [Agriterribacter sp.]|uniref:DUF4258 domain-containing protein n=1 Tax=Agriterribacter sp. TaxID=2821509 RepID=UPI002CBFE2D6|nr:DUF4258 domain-containing protein [Agriterribacter sp.]HRO45229.1 DUF4258 domain-containing protein [Agriterribacter sp.]HRQ16832.1 DUF4258 domain-containing protein [Agriterribacter sp.]
MKKGRFARYLIALLVCCGLFWLYYSNNITQQQPVEKNGGFNRALTPLIYTRHARCRMDCRHIDEGEIAGILQKGKINYSKSDLHAKPDPKYALEGITRDNQQVRVIFAPSKRGMVVITCIDMNEEWQCNCN